MDTKQIRYILEIANTHNFSKAAENLFVSQPTLTYQVRAVENEIGFSLFKRGSTGVIPTPAGEQFILSMKEISASLNCAIEAGQNFSSQYSDNLRIVVPVRSCICLLPQVMETFAKKHHDINITPSFDLYHGLDSFFSGDQDIAFVNIDDIRHHPDIRIHPLYRSHFYFVCTNDDPYHDRKIIHEKDIEGRTLMINGGSGSTLRKIQQRIITHIHCNTFNSNDHDTSLTNIAAHKAIVVAPGSLNDHSGMFTWIPFDCTETLQYALITHASDERKSLQEFIKMLQNAYQNTSLPL